MKSPQKIPEFNLQIAIYHEAYERKNHTHRRIGDKEQKYNTKYGEESVTANVKKFLSFSQIHKSSHLFFDIFCLVFLRVFFAKILNCGLICTYLYFKNFHDPLRLIHH